MLPGSSHPDEAVLYMAHWDHLGKHPTDPAHPDADTIYNGAVDNATGVAGVLEIAEAFATQEQKPARSVLFLAVTLEESGLLGSQYYVAHPVVPLDKTVAVFNIEARDYNEHRYHQPADEYDAATWKLDGTVQDLVSLYTIGKELAASEQWPNWYEGNPFKATRDAAMAKE